MLCYRCQKFGHTQQRCASNLVCGHCGENGHGEEPYPDPPHCVNCSGAHASTDRRCPVFLDEKAIQELCVKDSLSFLDAQKKFLENKPKSGTQSYASAVRRPQGTDAATQTTALPSRGRTSPLPRTTVPTQSEVSTQTEDLLIPIVSAVKIRACQPSALEVRQPRNICQNPPVKKTRQSRSRSGTRKKPCHAITVPDRSESPSDTSDSQMDHVGTPKGKHRGRLK
jgi:hypothetical protein